MTEKKLSDLSDLVLIEELEEKLAPESTVAILD